MKIKNFLSENGVHYDVTPHQKVFTAQAVAAVEHVPGDEVAKPVILALPDGSHVMLVCPASYRIDLDSASDVLGHTVRLADEAELQEIFNDVEVGAEPPFGSQYGLATYVDDSLADQDVIVFRAGNHTETLTIRWSDYERLEHPQVIHCATHL